jgi:hypothetical protein
MELPSITSTGTGSTGTAVTTAITSLQKVTESENRHLFGLFQSNPDFLLQVLFYLLGVPS